MMLVIPIEVRDEADGHGIGIFEQVICAHFLLALILRLGGIAKPIFCHLYLCIII